MFESLATFLFALLVICAIGLGALLSLTGAVMLAFLPVDRSAALVALRQALAILAFGVAGFGWGAATLPGLLL